MTDNQPCLLLSESKLSEIRKATDPLNPSTNRGLLIEYIAALLADINLLKSRTPAMPYQEAVEKYIDVRIKELTAELLSWDGDQTAGYVKCDLRARRAELENIKAALAALGIVEGKDV